MEVDDQQQHALLQSRLAKVQTAIHKATQDAWKHHSTNAPLPSPRSTLDAVAEQENASFLLGMDLFGQDTNTLERGIRDKLEDVEADLEKVLRLSNSDDPSRNEMEEEEEEDRPEQATTLDPRELQQQVQGYQHKIAFLKEASLARSALDEAATLTSAALTTEPDLAQASDQLVQATDHHQRAHHIFLERPMSSNSTQEHHVGQQILEGLQHSVRRQRVELIHKASSVLDMSILVASNELAVKTSHQLQEAYQVLETLEGGPLALEETLRRLTRRIYDQALSPLLEPLRQGCTSNVTSNVTPWQVTEKEDQPTKRIIGVSTSTTKGIVHRMEWHRLDEVNMGESSSSSNNEETALEWPVGVWKDTLKVLQQILVFVQSRVLLERPRLCELVGTKLCGKPTALPSQLHLSALGLESTLLGDDKGLLMEELVDLMAKTCLPDVLEASQITTLLPTRGKELLHLCVPFCKELVDRQLLALEPPPKLIKFCQEFEQNYVEHRRCVLLNQARDILRNHDYHNTISVGVDEDEQQADGEDPSMAIFLLHTSSVSEVASQLMALLRQTMTESVQMPATPAPTLRPTLYKTAREMLSLFRAIIPASHGHEVATVPRTAAVLHNDCIFFAHHCLTLGLEFKEQYAEEDARGKLLHQSCIFVDMVPLFRELADQSMGDMLDVQADQLVEIVGSRITYLGQALQSNESLHEWSEAETALAAGIYHLRHLAQSWRPILSKRIFAQSMGHLADVILTLFWNQVTPQSSTSTTIVISSNARHFLLGLFRKASEDLTELFGPPPQPAQRRIEDCSGEWGRFQALVQFLDMSNLEQVQAALANGVFRKVAGHELSRWIQAVHPQEAPERRALLQSLSSSAAMM
jgi:hypothetical protein